MKIMKLYILTLYFNMFLWQPQALMGCQQQKTKNFCWSLIRVICPASEKQSSHEFWNESKDVSYMPWGHVQVLQKQQKKEETMPRGISDHFISIFVSSRFDIPRYWINHKMLTSLNQVFSFLSKIEKKK